MIHRLALNRQASPAAPSSAAARALAALRTPAAALILLTLLALALRLWLINLNVIDPRYSNADDGDYFRRALRLAATGQYLDDFWLIRPPLHVFIFAGFLRIGMLLGSAETGLMLIRWTQASLVALTVPLGYDMARRWFKSPRTGWILAAFLTLWHPLVELPAHTFSEPLFHIFWMVHLWLIVRWRDAYPAGGMRASWGWLVGSGIILGLAALTRSPALYSAAFVGGAVLLETWLLRKPESQKAGKLESQNSSSRFRVFTSAMIPAVIFVLACVLTVAPWTLRNYLLYQRFIPVDTLGQVNFWLEMAPDREEGIAKLMKLPQADRQDFAMREVAKIIQRDPWFPWRNAGWHFAHIWKAQFIEDFYVKVSLFSRPLRESEGLGLFGDLLWLLFSMGGIAALVSPLREGAFRLIALAWVFYIFLTIILLHVEPRYLLPLWIMLALYGSWFFGELRAHLTALRQVWPLGLLAAGLLITLTVHFFSYRDYPSILATGFQREQHYVAGVRAYQQNDYPRAEAEFRAAVEAQPIFMDARSMLALALLAEGKTAEAQTALGDSDTRQALLVKAQIARVEGHSERAARLFADGENRAGFDVLAAMLQDLRPAPRSEITIGDGSDYGYIAGFSPAEHETLPDGTTLPYRWLEGHGQVVLTLDQPLAPNSGIALRLAGGRAGLTPLRVRLNGRETVTLQVQSAWRVYQLALPDQPATQRITIELDAPTFVPALTLANNDDSRSLSLKANAVWVTK